jgi:hypothetical protein
MGAIWKKAEMFGHFVAETSLYEMTRNPSKFILISLIVTDKNLTNEQEYENLALSLVVLKDTLLTLHVYKKSRI